MHRKPTIHAWYIMMNQRSQTDGCLKRKKIWHKHERDKCRIDECKFNSLTTLFRMDFCLFITMNGNNPVDKLHMGVIIHDMRLLLTTDSWYVGRSCGRWNIHATALLLPFYICNTLHSSQGKQKGFGYCLCKCLLFTACMCGSKTEIYAIHYISLFLTEVGVWFCV